MTKIRTKSVFKNKMRHSLASKGPTAQTWGIATNSRWCRTNHLWTTFKCHRTSNTTKVLQARSAKWVSPPQTWSTNSTLKAHTPDQPKRRSLILSSLRIWISKHLCSYKRKTQFKLSDSLKDVRKCADQPKVKTSKTTSRSLNSKRFHCSETLTTKWRTTSKASNTTRRPWT